jgi:hypothetical protein
MSLLENLKHIKEHGPRYTGYGLCSALWSMQSHNYVDEARAKALMQAWPEYSGYPDYPVPSYTKSLSPRAAYQRIGQYTWSPDHPYGAGRLRMLDFMIAELEKEV